MAAPVFNGLDNNPTYTENSSAVLLDNNASITDADIGASTPYTGATLTLARSAGTNVEDLFSGAPLSDGQVTVSGTIEDPESPGNFIVVEIIIGTYTNDDGTLVITFNDQATGDRITDVLRQLTYSNASDTPPSSIVVGYTFNNGDIATGSITVTINAVNDPPSIDALDGSALYQPGSGGVVLSPNISLSRLRQPDTVRRGRGLLRQLPRYRRAVGQCRLDRHRGELCGRRAHVVEALGRSCDRRAVPAGARDGDLQHHRHRSD